MSAPVRSSPRNHRYRHSRGSSRGSVVVFGRLALGDPVHDRAELAVEGGFYFSALAAWQKRYTLDQPTDRISRFVALLGMIQSLGEPLDLATVDLGYVGVDVRRIRHSVSQTRPDGILLGFEIDEPVDQGSRALALLRDRDETRNGLVDSGEFGPIRCLGRAALVIEPVALVDIGADRLCRDLRRHQPITQAIQHASFELLARDRMSVRASLRGDVVRADEAALTA